MALAARAVDVLVHGAWRSGFQVGDDESSIHAQWSGLDARDDSLDAIPACRAIVELLEPPDCLARRLFCPGRGAGFQSDDVFA